MSTCSEELPLNCSGPCLLLTFQFGSLTLCKLQEADHGDQRKDFFDDGQKTEISISADGDFCVMKKAETPSSPKDGELVGMSFPYIVFYRHS